MEVATLSRLLMTTQGMSLFTLSSTKQKCSKSSKHFEVMVTMECGELIIKLRIDNGGEYMSKEFQAYLTSKGIEHQLTVPHSPQQNGVAEQLNRTLMESARAMLLHSNLPNKS